MVSNKAKGFVSMILVSGVLLGSVGVANADWGGYRERRMERERRARFGAERRDEWRHLRRHRQLRHRLARLERRLHAVRVRERRWLPAHQRLALERREAQLQREIAGVRGNLARW